MKNNIYIKGDREKRHLIHDFFAQFQPCNLNEYTFRYDDCIYTIDENHIIMIIERLAKNMGIDPERIKTIDEIYEEF